MAGAKRMAHDAAKAKAPPSWADRLSALLNGAFAYMVRRALRLCVRRASPQRGAAALLQIWFERFR
jgi:hypothetical protein